MKKHIITLLFILVPLFGYTIKGIVKDSTNNSPLIGANVIIDGTSFGAATDSEGKYLIKVESKGDYLMIHTSQQRIVVYMTMKKFMGKTDTQLQRVHKSFSVSLSAIKYVEGNIIFLENKDIPIGASYKEGFLKKWVS